MAVRWESASARARVSSSALRCSATVTTGMVAAIPWLPEPKLDIATTGAPPIRASDAATVLMMTLLSRSLLSRPFFTASEKVPLMFKPYFLLLPSSARAELSRAASRINAMSANSTSLIKSKASESEKVANVSCCVTVLCLSASTCASPLIYSSTILVCVPLTTTRQLFSPPVSVRSR